MDTKQEEDDFERTLTAAMQRVEAPEGFAERVVYRAGQSPAPMLQMSPRLAGQRWIGGALAAALLVGAGGTWAEIKHRQRQQQEAERQFEVAMQVTLHALAQTSHQLNRAGLRFMDTTKD